MKNYSYMSNVNIVRMVDQLYNVNCRNVPEDSVPETVVIDQVSDKIHNALALCQTRKWNKHLNN